MSKIIPPAIILLYPQMGENIGMSARAMLNCGVTDLRIVKPRDGWPNEAAGATSSNAGQVIEKARVFETLEEAIADCRLVIALTSRDRHMMKEVITPEIAAQKIIAENNLSEHNACVLLIGPERAGLENHHITCCDAIMNIPLNPDYMSLNMAQAVLLSCYAWYNAAVNATNTIKTEEILSAPKEDIEALQQHLITALDETNFFSTAQQRPTMVQNLRNMIQRMRLTKQEVNTFRGIIKALQQKRF